MLLSQAVATNFRHDDAETFVVVYALRLVVDLWLVNKHRLDVVEFRKDPFSLGKEACLDSLSVVICLNLTQYFIGVGFFIPSLSFDPDEVVKDDLDLRSDPSSDL